MPGYLTRNRTFLAGVEAVAGTEEALTVGAHHIPVENPEPSQNFEVLETSEVGGSLDGSAPIVGGGYYGFSEQVIMRGSGVAGTAPKWSPLMRAAAMALTLTAVDVTGTAQAGAAGSITLEAGASAVDDVYIGMIIDLTAGTGAGDPPRVVYGYDGTTKIALVYPDFVTVPDVTTEYAVRASALYAPATADLETLTVNLYDNAIASATNSLLRKVIGASNNATFAIPTRGLPRMTFTQRGILPALPSNVAAPATPAAETLVPPVMINADVYLGGQEVKHGEVSFDLGLNIQQADDPGAAYGYDVAYPTSRKITGSINPQLVLLSERNAMSDFLGGTSQPLWIRWGDTAGNRFSMFAPSVRFTGNDAGDQSGYNIESLPFECIGLDTGLYVCAY